MDRPGVDRGDVEIKGVDLVDQPWRIGRAVALGVAVGTPILVGAVLGALRTVLAGTSAVLVLALVVVGVACLGYRSAGLVAALVAGLAFDFFLTAPYFTFAIIAPADVETLVALLLVGVASTELVAWGQRYRTQLGDRDAYLTALLAVSEGGPGWLDAVGRHLMALLDLDACTWVDVTSPADPRLDRDGEVRLKGQVLDAADGLPVHAALVLPVRPDDPRSAGFQLVASTHVARPTLRRRRLASALADQVGWVLEQQQTRGR